jgi:hypothetical protein
VTSRRDLMAIAGAAAASTLLPAVVFAKPHRTIPQRPSARVIIDNDFAGDPDGLIALAHQLLTPKTRTVLITSTALDPKFAQGALKTSAAEKGREVALALLQRGRFRNAPPVVAGSEFPVAPDPSANAAARAIVAEAMRDDPLPLIFTCGGPLTNLAAALRMEPAIAERMKVIWIGGGNYPHGGWEYNMAVDADAARHVIEHSNVPLWQVPQGAYRQMAYPVSALRTRLRPISPFAAWLYDSFTSPPDFIDVGGSWPLGDSPLVLLSAITPESSEAVERLARRINPDMHYGAELPARKITVFERLDARSTFDDFFALMEIHARGDV